ncbi:tetratricopeptide repeat protein [Persicimonas caeni]|uniref:Tetratricopeptide repeat protein n=1 Tax=Persicimonas caeni TaxID=2292766 RepID=A0A4Y6PUM6_PERCE|nr:tetratricopeptide repeat protein [Persicimonas caeni]QDG52044.1 tetratricopeptide repeat protein [Persicimonas caeni]QED33265.1 tetratricopeptide repeat protein [Persicimonas caeni]
MGINRNKVLNAARKQVRKGNWEKAISKYQQLVDDDPSDARSQLKIADLYSKLDRTEEALDAYGAVAKHYAADDIYEKAVAVYKQALRLAPDEPTLHRDLGDAYHRLGRLKDAVRSYHKAQKIYKQVGDAASQRELLERMIRLDPDDVGMRIQLAERYAKDNLHDQALELFEHAAEKLDDEGRIDEYVQVAERIIFLRDDALHLRRRVIDIYLQRNDNKHALKHLQVCFKQHPQNVGILELLVETFRRLDRHDKAVLVMHELANLYSKQSRQEDVAQVYSDILELAPNDKRAKKELQKLRQLDDSGVMTGRRDTGPLHPQRNHTPTEPPSVDALDGIEFLDEESEGESEVVEIQAPAARSHSASQHASRQDAPRQDTSQPQTPPPAAQDDVPQTLDEDQLVDVSAEIEVIEAVEPTIEHSGPKTTEEEIAKELKETDVFIKYGLHDKAYETIVGVIAKHPDSLQAREQMKKLQQARNNPEGAVDELLEMARITRTTPGRAQKFISEALELTGDIARVHEAAEKYGLTAGDLDAEVLDEIALVELDNLEIAEPSDAGGEPADDLLELDMGDLEFVDAEPEEVNPAELEAGFHEIEESVVEMSEIELDVDDLEGLELVEDTDAEMIEVTDDDLDFDESAFDDADVVDMDVDLDGLGELSDDQMVALDDADDSADGGGFGFDISEEEADSMFDDLFGDFDGPSEAVNLGGDDPLGELAEVDFFLQQGLVSEAEETLDRVQDENPQHRGIEKRARQIQQARQGIEPEANPFGARSLSQKFVPGAEHESTGSLNLGEAAFNNTSIELGTAYRDMGLYDEAIDELTQALDDPQAADAAHFHIALCEIEKGDHAAATERLQNLAQAANANGIRRAAQQKLQELGA